MSTKKITKRDYYNTLISIVAAAQNSDLPLEDGVTYEGLNEFVTHEIELLDAKAASAAKRAAEKKAIGDELRDTVYNILSADDYMTIDDIVAAIGNPDITKNKVTARLTQLSNLNMVEKTQVTIESTTEGVKSRKVSAYKRIG